MNIVFWLIAFFHPFRLCSSELDRGLDIEPDFISNATNGTYTFDVDDKFSYIVHENKVTLDVAIRKCKEYYQEGQLLCKTTPKLLKQIKDAYLKYLNSTIEAIWINNCSQGQKNFSHSAIFVAVSGIKDSTIDRNKTKLAYVCKFKKQTRDVILDDRFANPEGLADRLVVSDTKLDWSDAVEKCEMENGKLACLPGPPAAGGLRADRICTLFSVTSDDFHLWIRRQGDCHESENEKDSVLKLQYCNSNNPQMIYVQEIEETKLFFACEIFNNPGLTTTYLFDNKSSPTAISFDITTSNRVSDSITTTTRDITTASDIVTTTSKPQCCPMIKIRGLQWERNCRNEIVEKECPGISTGQAIWTCHKNSGKWFPSQPDLSDCRSPNITNLIQQLNMSDVNSTLFGLAQASQYYASFGGDLIVLAGLLDNVTRNVIDQLSNITEEKFDFIHTLTERVANCSSNMMSNQFWEDIPQEKRAEIGTQLMQALDRVAFKLAHALNQGSQTIIENHIHLQVMKEKRGSFENKNLTFPLKYDSAKRETFGIDDRMTLPAGFERDIPVDSQDPDFTYAVFVGYTNMRSILLPKINDRANFTENTLANSVMQSLSLQENGRVNLTNDLRFVIKHINEGDNPVCSFWNTQSLNWDLEGCQTVYTNSTHTECACDHLTNFAVLMDIHNTMENISEADKNALNIITIVGCSLSIVCFLICIAMTSVFKALWNIRNTIHRSLSICLLLAEVVLVSGLERTENKVLCSVIAGVLFYFFLSAFCWMLLEAVYIYLMLYKVFRTKHSYKGRYMAFGFGFPLIVVAITAGVNPKGFGTSKYCWLSSIDHTIWAFTGPVLVILVINLITLCYALRTAITVSRKKPDPNYNAMKSWIKGALSLLPLLGLTWLVGFFILEDSGIIGAYIFTILNSLQGVAIFYVQCVMNKKIWTRLHGAVVGSFRRMTLSSWTSSKRTASTNVASAANVSSRALGSNAVKLKAQKSEDSSSIPSTGVSRKIFGMFRTQRYDVNSWSSTSSSRTNLSEIDGIADAKNVVFKKSTTKNED